MPIIYNPNSDSSGTFSHLIIPHNASGPVNINVALAESFTINANDNITDIITTNWQSGPNLETRLVRVKAISAITLTVLDPDQVIGESSTVTLAPGEELVINFLNWPDV